ncbi:facilitated trehalose transporter Tret1-like isoform X2 [Photinus pyralis]|nr:facilitated trehalose transporter Tret1-like isoform X2 [Photinus pyralis]XP_031344080.1 facilitated trehalose transporter Tret1-like isoform X2 [Photinus pyralis]XP_031344087.1 facilitated trehalose transporter Tret1-like isoform X2 [Photinus pyralis]
MISQGMGDSKSSFQKGLPQFVAVMVKNILLVSFGMTLGYPTILIPSLTSGDRNEEIQLTPEQVSWIGSINLMCVPIGCLLSGVLTTPVGRRRSMQVICFPLAASWLTFNFAKEVWHVYLALSITGLCGGLVEAPVLSYVAEITTPRLRGMLSVSSTLSLTFGILLEFVIGSVLHWRTVALISVAPPVLSFILLCFMPESPHWLIMRNKIQQAQKSLAWLRGWTTFDAVKEEFDAMCLSHRVSRKTGAINEAFDGSVSDVNTKSFVDQPTSFFKEKLANSKNFIKKSFLWPLAMVSFIYFLANFTGSWTLQTYAVKIFGTLNSPMDKYHATILLGLVEFIGCLVCVFFVRLCGKRVMAFVSICAVGICGIVVGTYAYTNDIRYLQLNDAANASATPTIDSHNWVPLVFLIILAFVHHCGLKPLPWILIGEIYSHNTRATGCGISSAVSYLFGFLANKLFLDMIKSMTISGTYWFYAAISFVGCLVLYFILPETEGRSLQEISDHFAGDARLDNKFRRKLNEGESDRDTDLSKVNSISIS